MAAQDSRPALAHEAILSTWRLPTPVQERFLRFPEALTQNPYLAPPVWDALWKQTHASQHDAKELAARRLGPKQVAAVVASEHRFDVLCWFAAFNELSDTQIRTVVDSCDRPSALARAMLEDGGYSLPVQRWLASRLDGHNALVWAASRSDEAAMSDDEVVELLASQIDPQERHIELLIDRIFETRPHLVARLARTDVDMRVRFAITGSRFASALDIQTGVLGVDDIDDPAQWETVQPALAAAMAANPVCTTQVAAKLLDWRNEPAIRGAARARLHTGTVPGTYETVDLSVWFETMFAWVVEGGKAVPWSVYPRVNDMLAMLANPTVTQPQAKRLLQKMHTSPAYTMTAIDSEHLSEVLGALSERFSTSGLAPYIMAHHCESVPFFEQNLHTNYDPSPGWRDRIDIAPEQLPTQNVWMAPNATAAFVTDMLGDDPDLWEMFLGLAEHHTGRLKECAVAARHILT